MVALQRPPIATVGASALIRLPLCDLNAGQNLLNAAGDLLGFGQGQPDACRAQPITVYPDDLVHIPPAARVVNEDDLYRHPDHEVPCNVVNACRNAALIAA